MANEKNDIGDIVKKCKILLLDIEGTTTSISFVKDKLFPYAEENVKDFLTNDWETDDVKEVVTALRKLSLEDQENKVDGVVAIPGEDASKEDQIEGLVKSVKWQMSLDRKVGPLKQLQGLIWKKGYDKGDIKGHVYDDVSPALELWRSVEGQKVYIYSSGSVQAQKLLFGLSSSGDMLKLIDGHFDTAVGAKQEAASYTAIAEKIGCKAEEILFLTDIDKEAEAARASGVQAALVSREGNAPLAEDIAASYPVLYSFAELTVTKKRKPDPQDEQPAKVLKTDVEADVKTTIETEVKDSPNSVTTPPKDKPEELEKMEVEEEAPTKAESPVEKPTEEIAEKVETIVEEITDSNDIADIPISDAKPIIEESTEKTEQKETEMMEAESAETVNSDSEPKENEALKNGDKDAPVPEETPPVVITEIKDITNDKESLNEVGEMIEDLVPVVEEPPAQDMEELQNVGEVLEKECDEILSKVQDVTNLDNIPLKPLLNPIAEENLETENMDSNDIVEGILDTEQELEMKQKADDELKTAQEEAKRAKEEDKCEKQEVVNNGTATDVAEEKPTEKVAEEEKVANDVKVSEEKAEASSPTEEKVKESSPADEKVKESSPAEETVKESSHAEEKVKESSPAEEKVKESSPAEEKVKESSPAEEKVKESSAAEEKVKESSHTEEKAIEISPVEQKVEEASLPDTKVEESKVVEEEKPKSEEEIENKMETDNTPASVDSTDKTEKMETENKPETEEMKVDAEKPESDSKETPTENIIENSVDKPVEESSMETDQTETPVATNDSDKVANDSPAEEVKPENEVKETQVNGKTTNGDAEMVNLNGDSSKEDELSSRLSMENGKEVVNGANGDSADAEAKIENNGEEIKEVADIKVKTVAMDEPRNDPIEQPTEA